jgi:hypothetical protein
VGSDGIVHALWSEGSVGSKKAAISRANVHHPEDAIMTDAPEAAMRNDTEDSSRIESKMLE